ncbi:MAG: protein kinase [Deltaproteobacteria bacterium]|nr:protein kinase [Deltaproteobacteria bacterium]
MSDDGAQLPSSFGGGRYTVQRQLGRGGQKVVYLVRDTALGRDAALSLVDSASFAPDDIKRLRHEAQALASMGAHPHVVTVYDIGEEGGRPYIVSEYVAGGDLAGLIAKQAGPLHPSRSVELGRQILVALAAIHQRGIVHRDLKPSNVWLDAHGVAKLGDFGLALASDRSRLSMPGTVTGTPGYVAPEQLEGKPVDGRADLYSLGCMLYELVTGHPPFVGPLVSVISQHLHARPTPPSRHNLDLSPDLERLILSLLEKSPTARPASAAAALEMLEAIEGIAPTWVGRKRDDALALAPLAEPLAERPSAGGVTSAAPPEPSAPLVPPSPPLRGKLLRALPTLVAIIATGVAVGVVLTSSRDPSASMHKLALIPTREAGMALSSSTAWTLASRLIEEIDRYSEFRPVSSAGLLAARMALLDDSNAIPDETKAAELARKVGADTVAALAVRQSGAGLSVSIHVFDTAHPAAGVSSPREHIERADLDRFGPKRLGEHLVQALTRQWKTKSLTDEMPDRPTQARSFDAYRLYTEAAEYCLLSRYDQCEARVREALRMDPENPIYWSQMACALSYQAGREAEAEEAAQKAMALSDRVTGRHFAILLEQDRLWLEAEKAKRRGDSAEVERVASKVIALDEEMVRVWRDPWGLFYAAAAYQYFLEDIPKARALYADLRHLGAGLFAAYHEEAKLLYGDGTHPAGRAEAATLMWTFIECHPESDLNAVARSEVNALGLARPAGELPCSGIGL